MIRAVIFDCFGVLITDALQVVRDEIGRTNPEGADEISDIVQAVNRGMIEPGESNDRIAAILGVSVTEYRGRLAEGEVKDERLMTYIQELKRDYKTAMLSNIPGASLRRRFSPEELRGCFDVVVASGDIGFAKPEAEAYEYVADQLGVRLDECIFTDDRELFCEAARAVGMRAIEYRSFTQFRRDLEGVL